MVCLAGHRLPVFGQMTAYSSFLRSINQYYAPSSSPMSDRKKGRSRVECTSPRVFLCAARYWRLPPKKGKLAHGAASKTESK